jgi:hypothetical protein
MIFANLRCRVSYYGITLFVLASLLPPSTESSLPWLHVFDWTVPNAHQAKESPKSNRLSDRSVWHPFPQNVQAGCPSPYTQPSEPSLPIPQSIQKYHFDLFCKWEPIIASAPSAWGK